jgi:hypothetical protein
MAHVGRVSREPPDPFSRYTLWGVIGPIDCRTAGPAWESARSAWHLLANNERSWDMLPLLRTPPWQAQWLKLRAFAKGEGGLCLKSRLTRAAIRTQYVIGIGGRLVGPFDCASTTFLPKGVRIRATTVFPDRPSTKSMWHSG